MDDSSFDGPDFWQRAINHIEAHQGILQSNSQSLAIDGARHVREVQHTDGFIRSESFRIGMDLAERILSSGCYVELFKLDLRAQKERCELTFFLGRGGFQRVELSNQGSTASSPVATSQVVSAWMRTEEYEHYGYPIMKRIREVFNSFAEPICDEYD